MYLCIIFLISILALSKASEDEFKLDKRNKPKIMDFAGTARWLVNENNYGTLATISDRIGGKPFAQPKSFVDGGYPTNSTGVLYFYDSDMDASLIDISTNPIVSFSLTAASLGRCPPTKHTDPENPTCARATFSGTFTKVTDENESENARQSLIARHPMMASWPPEHNFNVWKITDINEIWLIDIYGGAKSVDPKEYYAYEYDI